MFKFLVSCFALLLALPAFADTPPYVRVRSIAFAGSGCPAGSVAGNISSDRQAFTLLFDQYVAEVGPGVPYSMKRKNCQLNIALDYPQGWSFTLFTVDYRGYAALQRGVTGTQQSSYYFQGSSGTGRLRTNYRGPMDQDYQIRDTLTTSALVWSPCGATRALNVNTEVRVDNSGYPNASGMMTTDSIDGQLRHLYGLRWQRCR